MSGLATLFTGFEARFIDCGEVRLFLRIGGSGPPLLLLHGYPETHAAWHGVAPRLAERFTVVLPDLRGYGRSTLPPSDSTHRAYSKRVMAGDMITLMRALGFQRFQVMGHDRGGRVAYRMALDFPDRVTGLVLIDIMSTVDQWLSEGADAKLRMFHWLFLAQPAPLPESLIGAAPREWVEGCLKRSTLTKDLSAFHPSALEDYHEFFADPDRRHATCEDYRAGASCDLADDRADRNAGRRITCPTGLVWGTAGSTALMPDLVELWRPWCDPALATELVGGHFLPEECPRELLATVEPFLAGTARRSP